MDAKWNFLQDFGKVFQFAFFRVILTFTHHSYHMRGVVERGQVKESLFLNLFPFLGKPLSQGAARH